MAKYKVAVVMGSDSDMPVMKEAVIVLKEFGISYEIKIMSAHRTPDLVMNYAKGLINNGFGAVIAGAGGAAHLPGVIAAYTTLPIIGVPILGKSLNGLDSLLSIVQMPAGVPVATVGINGASNAALLAVQMLAISDKELAAEMSNYKTKLHEKVIVKAKAIEESGI